ncbi:MAG: hypothetical protein MJ229_01200 [bacterium]|nr:hypothetical protein [bacterium]
MNFYIDNMFIVLLFPIWIFALIVLGRFFNLVQARRLISALSLGSLFTCIVFLVGSLIFIVQNANISTDYTFPFLKIQNLCLNLGIYVDKLSVLTALFVSLLCVFIQAFSVKFMYKDKSFSRFFGYINLFMFSIFGFIFSANLFQSYIFWALLGVSAYLLIGFWYKKDSVSLSAKNMLFVDSLSNVLFLTGLIAIVTIIFEYSGDYNLTAIPFVNIADIGDYLSSYTNTTIYCLICMLFVLSAIVISAQFPFHTWLENLNDAPAPVFALINSVYVSMGVFLLLKIYPIVANSELLMNLLAVVGGCSALICALCALCQVDINKLLLYSTSSQVGIVFLALGLGFYNAAFLFLITFMFANTILFLISGIVVFSLSGLKNIKFMGGMRNEIPMCAISFLIATISILGILFSGYFSKELILFNAFENSHFIYLVILIFVSMLEAFYLLRLYYYVFEGERKNSYKISPISTILNFSVGLLTIFVVLIGYFLKRPFEDLIKTDISEKLSIVDFNLIFIILPMILLVAIVTFEWYRRGLNKFVPKSVSNLLLNGFGIDDFYEFLYKKIYSCFSSVCNFVDKYIFKGLMVVANLISRSLSWIFSKMQTGSFQSYLTYSIIVIAIIFALLMFAYTMIIEYGLLGGG